MFKRMFVFVFSVYLFLTTGCFLFQEQIDDSLFAPSKEDTWTFMIYMAGCNNLEQYGVMDFNEMEYGLSQAAEVYPEILESLNIIVLYDRTTGYDSTNGDWDDTRLFKINPDPDPTGLMISEEIFDSSSQYGFAVDDSIRVDRNMGDGDTLTDFLDFCTSGYPADHYMVVLWDHGDGPFSFIPDPSIISPSVQTRAIAYDNDGSTNDSMSIYELKTAISGSMTFSSTRKIDLIGFDACLMGSVEIAYQLSSLGHFMAASMAKEWIYGWDYSEVIKTMTSSSYSSHPQDLVKTIVRSFHTTTIKYSDQTLSGVDLSKIETLKTKIDQLAAAIYNENRQKDFEELRDLSCYYHNPDSVYEVEIWPYLDITDFCKSIAMSNKSFSLNLMNNVNNVVNAVADSVVAGYAGSKFGGYYGAGSDVRRGLYIVFPFGDRQTIDFYPIPYYSFVSWYSKEVLDNGEAGGLDFCTVNSNGIVESWTELLGAWYDPGRSIIPWNSY